ncbi:MAG: hypothetical protein IKH75_08090 [Ruminococcus sp.]|nr:hypothetical protein [Ruminococcus sp.]
MFSLCCNSRTTNYYELSHNPKPISFSADMSIIIKKLLWYVPNIDSYQADKNELISDKLYNDFSFSYIIYCMGMIEENDVKWLEPKEVIDESDWQFFYDQICCNCQKIIISQCKSLSKTNDLLRCVRNCIAHGQFAIVDDYFIGFNEDKSKKKAIIKIKPKLLLQALERLSSPIGKVSLIGYAFKKMGYKVLVTPGNVSYDLLVEKNEKKYAIDLRIYKGKKFLHLEDIAHFLTSTEEVLPDIERILFIDTSKVTKEVRIKEKEIQYFRIIDITQVKEMLKSQPIDILQH